MATVVDRNTPSPLSVVDVPPPTHHARGARDGVDANATDIAQAPTGVDRDDASSGDLVNEKAPKETLSKRRKVKRHCGKFKWWYLLGTVILLAILLPIL